MKGLLRRLKGILGIGAIWGVVTGVVGTVFGVGGALASGIILGPMAVAIAVQAAGIGFILGCSFATVFTVLEGRKSFDQLSTARAGLWGGLAGAGVVGIQAAIALSVMSGPAAIALASLNIPLVVGSAMASYGAVSAALAAGTVAVAKRAPDALEGGGTDVSSLGGSGAGGQLPSPEE